jgi:polar amino acid transport system permease protein
MEDFLYNFANVESVIRVWPLLLNGLGMTILLGFVIVPGGMALGLAVAVLHSLGIRWLNPLLILYVDLFRAVPPIVLLLFIYYGLPALGIDLPPFLAAFIGLSLNSSGYYGEIFRAGIEGIPKGQMEAARSTGLGRIQAMAYVVLPQAIKNVIPPLTTNTLEVIKNSSIASVVTLQELLKSARTAESIVFNPTPLIAAAVIYFILLWPLVRLVSALDRREIARH